jgi:excisionase family DNA binding protein
MTSTDSPTPQDRHVLTGTLFRRRSSRVLLTEQPPPPKPEPVQRPAKVARMLALAHHLQGAIDRGMVADRATVARRLGLTRARVTQLLDLLMLAPDLQARVLELEAVDGAEPMALSGPCGRWGTPGRGASSGRLGPMQTDFDRLVPAVVRDAMLGYHPRVRESLNVGAAPMVEPWVSVEDVAKHLDVAKDSIYRWIEHRRLPAHKIGRLWKFKLSEVDEWVRAGGADFTDEKGGDL